MSETENPFPYKPITVGLLIGAVTVFFGAVTADILKNQINTEEKPEWVTKCVEKDTEYVFAYPKSSWSKLDYIPDKGVFEEDYYKDIDGSRWLTLNTSKAEIEPPEKVVYRSKTYCTEHKKVRKE